MHHNAACRPKAKHAAVGHQRPLNPSAALPSSPRQPTDNRQPSPLPTAAPSERRRLRGTRHTAAHLSGGKALDGLSEGESPLCLGGMLRHLAEIPRLLRGRLHLLPRASRARARVQDEGGEGTCPSEPARVQQPQAALGPRHCARRVSRRWRCRRVQVGLSRRRTRSAPPEPPAHRLH